MKNKIIWVDLDEILAELLDYLLEYNNYKIWNLDIKREDVKNYYMHKMPELDISLDEAVSWFRKPMLDDIEKCNIKPTKGSFNKLKELKSWWNQLIIVTARIESIFWEYTTKWINNHFPNIFDDIIYTDHFTDKHRDKWTVCTELWITYMIEDNMDYALELAEKGVITYVFEKPWNSHREEKHENVIRVKWWEEFLN